jgi:hypothetical protein
VPEAASALLDLRIPEATDRAPQAVGGGRYRAARDGTRRALDAIRERIPGLRRTPPRNDRGEGSPSRLRNTRAIGPASAQGGTYVLRDSRTGDVVRVRRTKNLERRRSEHRRDAERGELEFEVRHRTDEVAEQGLEQSLHDDFNPRLDRIRPVDPDNPRSERYSQAAERFLERWDDGAN